MPALARSAALLLALALLAALAPRAGAQPADPPPGAIPSVRAYGAKGDGRTDDTAAIQRALDDARRAADGSSLHDDYYGRPKALYFPPGVYLISGTLDWVGCCVTIQGAGPERTAIRLRDAAPGFSDPAAPKPLIRTPAGNMSFRQYLRDIAIHTGRGNPGAVGVDYISNNTGGLLNVLVRSADGRGVAGISMTRQWPGPLLLRRVQVEGFDVGIDVAHAEYGPTFERIVLRGQRVAGIRNRGNTLAIRGLDSQSAAPAIVSSESFSSLVLLDADLRGAPGAAAVESAGLVYARNLVSSGYRVALRVGGADVPGAAHAEYISGQVRSLFPGPARSLNLPVAETPDTPALAADQWATFSTGYYGDTSRLQAALNAGKPGVAFPFGGYLAYNERAVTVPDGVRLISGFASVVNGDSRGANGGGIRFIVEGDGPAPLVIEQFGYGVKVEHRGARPVVLRHGAYAYSAAPGAGDLFIEDVVMGPNIFRPGQRVWARQYNNEHSGTKVSNAGADLWVLGLKTEATGTVIETTAGGRSELLGTLIYPSRPFSQPDQAAFVSRDSSVSLIYSQSVYCAGCGYPVHVREARGAETRQLDALPGGRMALFAGFVAPAAANQPPQIVEITGVRRAAGSLRVEALVSDPDSPIAGVTFLVDGVALATDRIAPYCVETPAAPGQRRWVARAADRFGATADSPELVTQILVDGPRSSIYLPAIGALGGPSTPAGQTFDNPFGTVSECAPTALR